MKLIPLQIVLSTIFALSLSSCRSDIDELGKPSGELTVRFTVNLPGSARSLGVSPDEESAIETLDVLAFVENGNGDFVYTYPATNISQTPGTGNEVTVTARVREYARRQQFMVLANASQELAAAGIIHGKKLVDAADLIVCDAGGGEWPARNNGSARSKALPMYGKTGQQVISPATGTIGTYPLVRMVSRIDVTLAAAVNNFRLANASLFNYKKAGYVSYERSGFSGTAASVPAVPASGDHPGDPILEPTVFFAADYTGDSRGEILRSIYTYESPAITSDAGRQTGTALVIGGYYGTNTNDMVYYRVDIKTTDDASSNISSGLIRNHHYKVEIQSVSNAGYPSAIEAYKGARPIDFTVEVIPWGENSEVGLPWKHIWGRSNIVWDGSKLTFAVTEADNAVIPANVQGVFFQWGSLVAVSPVGEYFGDGTGTTSDPGKILHSANGTTDYRWTDIPITGQTDGKFGTHNAYEDDFDGYNDGTNKGGPGYNASTNKGDICRYISARGWVQGKWRLPTAAEYDALLAETASVGNGGGFTDISGAPSGSNSYGDHANGYWQPESGYWMGKGAASAATRGTEAVPGASSVYFPAGGYRRWHDSGTDLAGSYGFLWAGSSYVGTVRGYRMSVGPTYTGVGENFRMYNLAVRCIRDVPARPTGPGGQAPILWVNTYRSTMPADGGTYRIGFVSNTEWEASVRRSTDVVSMGSASAKGGPLLDPATGWNGGEPSAYVSGWGNGELTLTTVDYTVDSEYAEGDLVIVFRDKVSGVILAQASIKIKSSPWGRSNIVWDGSRLTFAVTKADNAAIPANVHGVLFRWGSLVAISPVGKNYASYRILHSANGTTGYLWDNIPYAGETSPPFDASGGESSDNFAAYNGGTGYNASANKGDICRYISAQGWVKGNWRLPTQAEYGALMAEIGGSQRSVSNGGGFADIQEVPSGSNSYGDHAYGYWQPASGRWLGAGAADTGTRGTETVPGTFSVYFPAGGYRYINGVMMEPGGIGFTWSGSSGSGENGYCLYIGSSDAAKTDLSRKIGFPVRCIRE